jgi:hypothetical protein
MGLVEMIISGTGIVKDMYFFKEMEVVDPTRSTKSTASSCLSTDEKYLHARPWNSLHHWKAYHKGGAAWSNRKLQGPSRA